MLTVDLTPSDKEQLFDSWQTSPEIGEIILQVSTTVEEAEEIWENGSEDIMQLAQEAADEGMMTLYWGDMTFVPGG